MTIVTGPSVISIVGGVWSVVDVGVQWVWQSGGAWVPISVDNFGNGLVSTAKYLG